MPKRRVRHPSWEVESERMRVTASMRRRMKKANHDLSQKALKELEASLTDEEAFYALPRAAFAAFNTGDTEAAETHANHLLVLAESYKDNWNYGNALHAGRTVLGLVALERGNKEAAANWLIASAETHGSAQLGSFGPTMQLANALLKAGESDAVLNYLCKCKAFWHSGAAWLRIWESKVKRGVVPNFLMHSYG